MGCGSPVAGARVVDAEGCGWGSSNAGSASRRVRARVGIRQSLCRQSGMDGPFARRSEVRRSPSPGCPPLGGCRGPPPACCGRRCAGAGAQHCPLGLHALWGAACCWGGGGLSRGVGFPLLRGASGVTCCPSPCCPSSGGWAARVPRPVCPGCGRCGRGDPASAPQRVPLRAIVARCGGGERAFPGGVPSAAAGGV